MRRMFPGQRAHQGSTWQLYRYIRSFAQRSYGKQGLPIAAFPSFVPYLCFVVMYRTDRIILIFFISACAVFVVLHNFLTCPSPAIKKMVEGVEVLDTMCSKMASDCYIVKQSVYKNFQINRFVVSQKHSHGGRYTISKTPMKINSQGKLTFNRSTIAFECLIVGAVAPFALNPSLFDKKGYVLSIGLGGASYDMFFYSNFPKLDVTVVELDPTIATMAKNGLALWNPTVVEQW
ncbi:hypothetical protein L596_028883 [Steinernema carpocapsae]|uniref:PABS domain-containing protein n=1 Tax=Steinernema carpocapsae TaxID=34508 RepID=A0A4U5LZN3_STECR|nr:hypothetical protein L596_028883 [Steinernema carpocapsae]